ncbi:hypothetical protein C173_01662 [Paenibacillus sp. FSL R7-277]|uniref:phage tail-collar fiber domain-containing protein n=1 Tax=Paenibacillus sp. FSL R7-277 TaxID=1227352 RepID=UPI0003E21B5D|nr:phage tail protein [Paenibacillus sp. FSL R7-277]ETT78982.1 hypothetical protein C173_01662 [Paenibacillus sp. FSL R7-277]
MAVFGGMTLTNKGLVLQGKAQAGGKLNYTRIAVGDGSLTGQAVPAMNGLISQKISLPITRITTQPPNKAIIGSVLRNADVSTGFYWREVGVFAQDPDAGEILYAYANAGVTADYIPPGGGSDIIEKTFDCVVVVGTAANITAVIDESLVFAKKTELDALADAKVDKVSGKGLSANDYTTAEKNKLAGITAGAGGAGTATDAVIGNRTISDTTAPTGDSGTVTNLLGWLANTVKSITGKSSWRTAPATTLEAAKAHADDATRHLTAADRTAWNAKETTAGAQAKADVAQAAAATDASTKANAVQANLTNHVGNTTAHITASERSAWNAKADASQLGRVDLTQTLGPGTSVVTANQNGSELELVVQGRTLTNIAANTTVSFIPNGAYALVTTENTIKKYQGVDAIKVTYTGTVGSSTTGYQILHPKIDPTKYYVFAVDVQVVDATSGRALFEYSGGGNSSLTVAGAYVTTLGSWQTSFGRVGPTELNGRTGFYLHLQVHGSGANQSAIGTGFRMYEVSKSEYDLIGTTVNASNFNDYYPFVAGRQHVQGIAVTKQGRNLLPAIPPWLHANAKINGPYDFTLSPTATYQSSNIYVDVLPNTTYTFRTMGAGGNLWEIKAESTQNGGVSFVAGTPRTITTKSDTYSLRVEFTSTLTSGTINWKEWMLVVGDATSLPESFTPAESQTVILPVTLGQIGDVRDSIYNAGNEWMYVERVRKESLNGTRSWFVYATGTGYKVITTALSTIHKTDTERVIKYDGTLLKHFYPINAADQSFFNAAGSVYFSVSVSDSGWGDSFAPSGTELAAYLYGYKMNNGTFGTPYNGSGTKTWTPISATSNTGAVTSVPTTQAPEFNPYTVDYLLAQAAAPISVPNTEGSITLHPGGNQISVETGVIQRESVVPKLDSGRYYVLSATPPGTYWGAARLSKESSKMLAIYKGAGIDNKWRFTTPSNVAVASLAPEDFDPKAAYYVTYIARDKYALTTNVTETAATWRTGLGGVVSDVVQSVAELRQDNDRQDFADDYIEAKVDNLWRGISDASALPDAIQKFKLTESGGWAKRYTGTLNSLSTPGYYYIPSTPSDAPSGYTGSGILEILRLADSTANVIQRLTIYGAGRVFTRGGGQAGGWGAWQETGMKASQLANNTDLNTLPEGEYFAASNASAATHINMPAEVAGVSYTLKVSRNVGDGVTQLLTTYLVSSPRMFVRSNYNGLYGAWYEIETTRTKNAAGGYAGLDSSADIALSVIPDVVQKYSLTKDDGKALTIPAGTDLNTLLTIGFYTGNNLVNAPGGSAQWFHILVQTHSGASDGTAYVVQRLISLTDAGTPVEWIRRRANTVWQPWASIPNSSLYNVANGIAGLTSSAVLPDNIIPQSITRRVPLTNQLQKSSYYRSVVALCELTNTNPSYNSYSNGLLTMHRGNGLSGQVTALVNAEKRYNTTTMNYSAFRIGTTAQVFRPCTFTYNGVKYGGIDLYITDAEFSFVEFNGATNFGIFAVDYYNNQTSTKLNSEIFDSLNTTTDHTYINDISLNGSGLNAERVAGKTLAEVVQGSLSYLGTLAGSSPNYTCTANPPIAALAPGQRLSFKALSSTSGPITLNVNGLGAKSIKKPNGNNPPLVQGGVYTVVYDGTAFILQGEGGEYGTAEAAQVLTGYTVGRESGVVNGAMPNRSAENNNIPPLATAYWKPWDGGQPEAMIHLRPPDGYYNGSTWVSVIVPDLLAQNLPADKNVLGMQGAIPRRGAYTDSSSTGWDGNYMYVRIPQGVYQDNSGLGTPEIRVSAAQARADGNIIARNIRAGVWVYGIVGTLKEGKQVDSYGDGRPVLGAFLLTSTGPATAVVIYFQISGIVYRAVYDEYNVGGANEKAYRVDGAGYVRIQWWTGSNVGFKFPDGQSADDVHQPFIFVAK